MRWLPLGASVIVLALAVPASANPRRCMIEYIFGATNIHAVTGHGRMSVGVSAEGDLTVLSWPSPSYADQLAYMTSNAIDARMQPRLGAKEGAGSFLGLVLEHGDGSTELTWLRGDGWTITQDYGPDDGANVHTRHRHDDLGLTVTVVDAVDPEHDVLVRHVRVERDAGADVAAAWLLTYANLSPIPDTSRIPELPFIDWAFVGEGDERRADQRVSNPHLWEGALFYLTAMAMEDPDALTRYDDVLPASQVPAPFTREVGGGDGGVGGGGGGEDGGCCAVAPGRPTGDGAALVTSLVRLGWSVRRRLRARGGREAARAAGPRPAGARRR